MNRSVIFGVAVLTALVGLAVVSNDTAVAGHHSDCNGWRANRCGGGFLARMHARHAAKRCGGCDAAAASCCEPAPAPECGGSECGGSDCGGRRHRHGLFARWRARRCNGAAQSSCCEPAPAPSGCETGCGDAGCGDAGCGGCEGGCGGEVIVEEHVHEAAAPEASSSDAPPAPAGTDA